MFLNHRAASFQFKCKLLTVRSEDDPEKPEREVFMFSISNAIF